MFLKRGEPYALVVGMAGVKMGDRFLQIGCADGERLAAIAQKVGLSGRVVAAAPRRGLGALLSRGQSAPLCAASGDAIRSLQADGFRSVRTLAEREGLVFVEGIKPRD